MTEECSREVEKKPVKTLGPYQFSLSSLLGRGMSGDVYLGTDTRSKEQVCIKVIDLASFKTEQHRIMLFNQIKCQQKCKSPYILSILDIFDSNSFCFIVTEYCGGGDLYRLIKNVTLQEETVKRIGIDLAKALKVLKDAQIIHRDIKSENILLGKHNCKIGDFGFANENKIVTEKKQSNVGSPLYMSPQALQYSKYSYSSDVFAFGAVLYEMLHKQCPWQSTDENQLKEKMKNEKIIFKEGISEELKDLMEKCLAYDQRNRITVEQILECKFFKQQ